MFNPVSTYRIQFHKGFTFKQFEDCIPYLAELGVRTVYASPIFKATPGSMHGYDITDPLTVNPEIGSLTQLYNISGKLKRLGIGWLQDIVPNHMAFHPENQWLMDVLKKGRESAYAPFFDIIWDVNGKQRQLMVPFLGQPFNDVVKAGEIELTYNNGLYFTYNKQNYPLNKESYSMLGIVIGTDPDKSLLKKANADHDLINRIAYIQHYRLCSWGETNSKINYRRFFTVNGLICLNIHDKMVFDNYHELIGKLTRDGVFQGLRVDHIDGLYDPKSYLIQLRALAGKNAYIITEKILEAGESFPNDWPVQGNTGYDALSALNNLFTNNKNKKQFTAFYETLLNNNTPVSTSIFEKKRLILENYMPGELDNLYLLFQQIFPKKGLQETPRLKDTIAELMILFPVYRLYGSTFPLPKEDLKVVGKLLNRISEKNPDLAEAIEVIENVLWPTTLVDSKYNNRVLKFYMRLMQFTGPLMAKGVEDTLMYTYNLFVEHNEVGDSPGAFGLKPKAFHKRMFERKKVWPISITATSTHDTKRGEDVRARLNVLSDLTDEWIASVWQWRDENAGLKTNDFPNTNDEYFIYQTIVGAFPMPGEKLDDFEGRLNEYLTKALREGKIKSDWAHPNEEYETAAKKFAKGATDRIIASPIFPKLADYGIVNALAQVLLKYTTPGVPDLYQGCEYWDLSLVDPDNRRPVDYHSREQTLKTKNIDWKELWDNRYNGVIKQQLVHILMKYRNNNQALFSSGEYIPLKIKGRYKDNFFAFARQFGKTWTITAIPLHFAAINAKNVQPSEFDWEDTKIRLPDNAPQYWQNIFEGQSGYAEKQIQVKLIFKNIPLALLQLNNTNSSRAAGILMHITSLPSDFGVGDFGTSAYQFVDFLFNSGQKYWQLLPLNPVDCKLDFSPYSSTSALAGNTMLISPEMLVKMAWLNEEDLTASKTNQTNIAAFEQAEIKKRKLFNIAYNNFLKSNNIDLMNEYEAFKSEESYWLDDFAMYEVLKVKFRNKPWYEWPRPYKLRQMTALNAVNLTQKRNLEKIKWLQWVFIQQWNAIKSYCVTKNITILGDMSFYVSYDSVDVWSNSTLFKLDSKNNIDGVAGVPPDYFSADGQLWGMPVYNWVAHKKNGYNWWIRRIKRNLKFYDIIRLDHFRAFSEYWEVPTGNENAKNGKWQTGPGKDFFNVINEDLGYLPFVAEDLGKISDDVYNLRDEFKLPGMRVLQFAFDETLPVSPHIPHNYIQNTVAYTGTHDNNTSIGWFQNNIDKHVKSRLEKYIGKPISAKNVHREMIKLCYASVANIAIVPMQDVLGLREEAKMNTPSSEKGNWRWRVSINYQFEKPTQYLKKWVRIFNR